MTTVGEELMAPRTMKKGSEPAPVDDNALKGMLGDLVAEAQREGRKATLKETARAVALMQENLSNLTELGTSAFGQAGLNAIKAQDAALAAVLGWISDCLSELEPE